jgi:hypothetical protein
MKLTVRQAKNFYQSVAKMKDAGVSAKGVKMLDIAMNKATIEPMIVAYEKLQTEAQDLVAEYNRKLSLATKEDVSALDAQYAEQIAEFRTVSKNINAMLDEEKDLNLVPIKKSDLIFKEDNGGAAEVIFGLSPCLME